MQNSRESRFLWITGAAILGVAIVVALYALLPGSGKSRAHGTFSASLTIAAVDRGGQEEITRLSCLPPKSIVHGDYVPAVTLSGYALRTPAELCGQLKTLSSAIANGNNCSGPGHKFGPETATLKGIVDKQRVSMKVTRNGDCEEKLFASLVPLLPLAAAPTANGGGSQLLAGYRAPKGTLTTSLNGDHLTISLSPPVGEALSHKLLGSNLVLSCPSAPSNEKSTAFTWPASSDDVVVTIKPPLGTCQLVLNEETILTIKV